jgi:hypothetical protein
MKPGLKIPFEPGLMPPGPHFQMNRADGPFSRGSNLIRDKWDKWKPLFPLVCVHYQPLREKEQVEVAVLRMISKPLKLKPAGHRR